MSGHVEWLDWRVDTGHVALLYCFPASSSILSPAPLPPAAIMRALLVDLGGGQWRVREAAALAMGDLLQGRRWGELQPHFEQLWVMTLR